VALIFEFGGHRFDDDRGLEGPAGRIPLRRGDAAVLRLLLEADGRTVSKDQIAATAWSGREVSDDSIFQAIRRLRRAMPSGRGSEIIQTIQGAGFRMGVPARVMRSAEPSAMALATSASVTANACLVAARELSARRTPADLAAAIDAAQRATEIDPGFVAAWCALAELTAVRASLGLELPARAGDAAIHAAEKALQLDPDCSPALAIRGWVRSVIYLDIVWGLADFAHSLRITDGYWAARAHHAWALLAAGQLDRAVTEMQAAHALNPWGVWHAGFVGLYLYFARRFDEALADVRSVARQHPGFDTAQMRLSIVASGLGLHDEAIAAGRIAMERAPDTPIMHTALASALARAGHRDEALALVRKIEASSFPIPGAWLASAWLALGHRERALERLQQARRDGSPHLVYALVDPRLDALRGDPAFEQLKTGRDWSG
jgi:DNA-binding winged helix-turn-helix (wHTH) protein